jgi:hypothetical protein
VLQERKKENKYRKSLSFFYLMHFSGVAHKTFLLLGLL